MAGNAFIAVGIEGIKVNTGPSINATIDFRAVDDFLAIAVHDAGSGVTVGIEEIAVFIGGIIGPFGVAVAKWRF